MSAASLKEPARHHDPTWPYEDVDDHEIIASDPAWACAAGFCQCPDTHDRAGEPEPFAILLCDEDARRMPGARCRVLANGILLNEDAPHADGAGWITLKSRRLPEQVLVEWAPPGTPLEPRYPYRKLYYAQVAHEDRAEAARRRLHNLGYAGALSLEDNIRALQRDYDRAPTGQLDDVEPELVAYHDHGAIPPRGAPTTRTAFAEERDLPTPQVKAKGRLPPGSPAKDVPAKDSGTNALSKQKSRRVVVRWLNPKSEFLRDNITNTTAARVLVQFDQGEWILATLGSPTKRDQEAKRDQEVEFDVPEKTRLVNMRATFRPTFGKKPAPRAREVDEPFTPDEPVFEAIQSFSVDEDAPYAIVLAAVGDVDPLVKLDNRRTYEPSPAAIITLVTHFVDATEVWKHYSKLSDPQEFQWYEHTFRAAMRKHLDDQPDGLTVLDGGPWTSLRVLGSTAPRASGAAIYWLAFCPNRVRMPGAQEDLVCLLLCRHEGEPVKSAASLGLTMHGFNQFLFDRETAFADAGTSVSQQGFALKPNTKARDFAHRYSLYLRAGYGRSIARASQPVFMLCPHVDGNATELTFGKPARATIDHAIRYLWARDHLERGDADVAPPDPQLAAVAFSQGGLALWPMLRSMGDDLSAVMSVAGNDTAEHLGQVLSWLEGDPERLFFMIIGQTTNWSRTGRGPIESFVDKNKRFSKLKEATPRRFYIYPSETRRYRFYRPGPPEQHPACGRIWYDTVNALPAGEPGLLLAHADEPGKPPLNPPDESEAHHAWAFFGGPDEDPNASSTVDYESFLDRFLSTMKQIQKK